MTIASGRTIGSCALYPIGGQQMQEETFRHKLDIYYLAAIGYFVTLIAYAVVKGTLSAESFEIDWRDPILYLLAGCSIAGLAALIVAAVSNRTVIVAEHALRFRTRFRERVLAPEQIEWIGFRRERQYRGELSYPAAKIKLRGRRRLLRLRLASFERSGFLARSIRDWARANNVALRVGRSRRGGRGE